jgi:hypothetical protein
VTSRQEEWLSETLALSVPLAMMELIAMGEDRRASTITRWLREASTILPGEGDHLLWPATPRTSRYVVTAGTQGAFVAITRGLAATAFSPTGITFLGRHWCVDHCPEEGAPHG